MPHVTVVATLVAQSGKETQVEALLRALVTPTRAEDGCIRYDLHRDLDNPGAFVFYETWASRAALDAHSASEHLARFAREGGPLLASRDVKVMELLEIL